MNAVFLDAIRAAPDEDAPRLVYADWLEEQGDGERAEFIRVQCRLAALPPSDPRRAALEDRQDDLLALHEADWLGSVPGQMVAWEFRRGFVEGLTVDGPTLEPLAAVFARHPVRRVEFQQAAARLPALLASPFLDRLDRLRIRDAISAPAVADLEALLMLPQLSRLGELSLSGDFPQDDLVPLLACRPGAERLRHLDLSDLSDAGAARLVREPRLGSVCELRVDHGQRLTGQGVADLTATPERWTALEPRWAVLPLTAFRQLAACPRLRRLTCTWPVGHDGPLPVSPALRTLDFGGMFSDTVSWSGLARQDGLEQLHSLEVSIGSLVDPPGPGVVGDLGAVLARLSGPVLDLTVSANVSLAAVLRLPGLDRLRSLSAGYPEDEDIQALAECQSLVNLHTLELGHTPLHAGHMDLLANAPALDRLRELTLVGHGIGDRGLIRLLESGRLRHLRRWCLECCGVRAEGVAALAAWPGLRGLRDLNLTGNRLDGAAVRPLLGTPYLSDLVNLAFDGHPALDTVLTRADVQPLAERLGARFYLGV